MDLETENRLAALLMEEARHLHLQADKGVGIYLCEPKVRGRPNARFLTATVLGVQQANRAVEINEMWQAREKELDLDNKLSHWSKDIAKYGRERHHDEFLKESTSLKHGKAAANVSTSQSSRKYKRRGFHSEYDALQDEEVEEFLQSRMKRGRGAVGSRMDEPGPYPVCSSSDQDEQLLVTHESSAGDEGKRQVLGPEKPSWLLTREQHEEESSSQKTAKEDHASKPSWLLTREQHKEESSSRKTAKEDHASRSKRRHSEDKYTSDKSKKRRKDKSRRHHRRR